MADASAIGERYAAAWQAPDQRLLVELIAATTIKTGLRVRCELDTRS